LAAGAVEEARAAVARCLQAASAGEIVFTSGASEGNNLALKGAAAALASRGRHLVTQVSEHPSVLAPLATLGRRGFEVTVVEVDRAGRVDPGRLASVLRPDTVLVSVMLANNETGVVQPVEEVVRLARAVGAVVHCDAAQGVGRLPLRVADLGVDLLTLSGHKVYGPKGVGALYLRRRRPPLRLEPLVDGGGQEGGLRAGTVNVPGVVGLARALELATAGLAEEAARLARLRDRLEGSIRRQLDGVAVNGGPPRLAGTTNLSFAGVDGPALLTALADLAVSTGAACSSGMPEPSAVLRAMGVPRELAAASLRFGVGRFTTEAEVDRAVERVVREVTRLRRRRRR
jgi:cysteine desulfurase